MFPFAMLACFGCLVGFHASLYAFTHCCDGCHAFVSNGEVAHVLEDEVSVVRDDDDGTVAVPGHVEDEPPPYTLAVEEGGT